MKKYLLLFIIIFLTTGCISNNKKTEEQTIITNNIEETKEEIIEDIPEEPTYKDENPVIVGIYQKGKLITNLNIPIIDGTDIASFDVYFTNEEDTNDSNTKRNFKKYAANYENINKYKIGFIVSFSTKEEIITKMITTPNDTFILAPYIFNYLYDDIHQPDGTWYSHVEEADVNENTIYSSIKLCAVSDTDKIISPISLTVFTYDTLDDFDENGMYRGNSKYTITINHA